MAATAVGEWERSLGEATSAYEDGKAIDYEEVTAEGILRVGYCCLSLGRMDAAGAALDEAIARSAGVCDFLHALSLTIKGMLRFMTGDLDAGRVLIEEARVIQERLNDREGGGMALSFLAQMSFAKGDLAGAIALYGEALASLAAIGDQPEIARVHCEMGWTALAAGDAPAAQRSFRLGVQANEGVGSSKHRPRATWARCCRSERRPLGTRRHDCRGLALSRRTGVVIEHPMDPGVVHRIEALKASIPKGKLDGLVATASVLSPAAVLTMVRPVGAAGKSQSSVVKGHEASAP